MEEQAFGKLGLLPYEFYYLFTWREYYNKLNGFRDKWDRDNILLRGLVSLMSDGKKSQEDIFALYRDMYFDPREVEADRKQALETLERGKKLALAQGLKLPDAVD